MESVTTERKQLEWVVDQFNEIIRHRFLAKYVSKPKFDEDKTVFLIHALRTPKLDETEQLERVTSALLVDAALTTHQYIPLHNDQSYDGKQEQLTVLAGDLYSSLYYKRLTKMADIPLMRVFSESIQTMNNAKVRLHNRDWNTIEELEQLVAEMESMLITNLAAFYQQSLIQRIASVFLTLRRIRSILFSMESGQESWGSAVLSPMLANEPLDKSPEEEKQLLADHLRQLIKKKQVELQDILNEVKGTLPAPLMERLKTVIDE
ncbi:hypothetical protein HNR44_000979 [Geomicrobium halophilum]|uniref:Heptaprenyl diphosphate synthase n=1 Tax=Geomicrobium halophilum TaxID=549000 RepID=A0A841PJS3_9BACL|nr:heptaprenyl diphosphate synthase component 1 [Geomicrobium halophilum]MBB6449030.1 hypothetical protein [Geomicrobium halophilum]